MAAREVVVIDGARTPIGRFGGALRDLSCTEIGAVAMKGALERSGVRPAQVSQVFVGHARQAGNGPNPGRIAAIKAGVPASVPVLTVQQACLSGMQAAILGTQAILLGDSDVVLACGMEHHSSIPFLSTNTRWGARMGDVMLYDAMYKDGYICGVELKHMGALTDDLAKRYGITRQEQDQFAVESQQKADQGKRSGFNARMIVPVEIKQARGAPILFKEDEHPRPDTTLETLGRLSPAFNPQGTVTAGNASGITDGAAALVLASGDKARELGLKPRGTVRSYAVAAVEPRDFAVAPVPAVWQALERASLSLKDIDLVEINEAFAAQMLAVIRDLGLDPSKVNVYGGAVALGHPTGMSGARIIFQLLYELEETGGRYGVATLCGNGGHGAAVVVERA
ncbi:MAG: acetyl-CoA C-acetyltransferase [Chloroflexi bacterium]|nr:acetyl-CoA C-acetyltransferase [Chloroflexota bacterium]